MAHKLKPFFSIIIPALNEAKYLPHLLEDLASQTYLDFEVIVVDGHSIDDTVRLAQGYASQLPDLQIIYSKRRHVCTQRNLGADHAKADWLIFMDADNRLPPYFLQGIKYRLESESVDIATCWLQSDRSTPKDKSLALALNIATDLMTRAHKVGPMEALFIVTQPVFQAVGGFDETINLSEGIAFLKQAHALNYKFTIFKDPVYTYSFRRLRKYGALNLAGRLAQHEIAKLLDLPLTKVKVNNLYPMKGGKFFDTPLKRREQFNLKIEKIFKGLFKEQ